MDKVGILGYGAMGSAFADLLRRDPNVDLVAYDTDTSALERARQDGVSTAPSASALGEVCDIVDVIVRTDEEMLEATVGAAGALGSAPPGAILLLHSSVLPKTTAEIASAADSKGVRVADACAVGTPDNVRAGNLRFLVGADDDLLEEVRPHLLRMAKDVLHVGPLGAGNVAKLIKNLVNASQRLVLWEALQIGECGGISYVDALEMMRIFAADNPGVLHRWEHAFDSSGSGPLPRAGTNLYDKDVPLAAELARSYGLELPITEQLAASARLLVELNEARAHPPG